MLRRSLTSIINVAWRKARHLIDVNPRKCISGCRYTTSHVVGAISRVQNTPNSERRKCPLQRCPGVVACRLIDAGLLAASFGRGGVNCRWYYSTFDCAPRGGRRIINLKLHRASREKRYYYMREDIRYASVYVRELRRG